MRYSWLRKCRWALSSWLVVSILALGACGAAATATPTPAAPAPTAKPTTRAAGVTPTATPAPTPTFTPEAVARPAKVSRLHRAAIPPRHETLYMYQTPGQAAWHVGPRYETFLRVTPSGDIGPMLATSWAMSADAKTWTIVLSKGVQFHEHWGECTARDVVHSLERLTAEASCTTHASPWRHH